MKANQATIKTTAKTSSKKQAARKPVVKTKAAPKATAKRTVARAPRGTGIGSYCSELILRGKSTEEVLAAVHKKFPESHTTQSSVAWYRSKLHKEGKLS